MDDIYPRDGEQVGHYYPSENTDAKQEHEQKKAVATSSKKLLKQTIDWFEKTIKEMDSLALIDTKQTVINGVVYQGGISVEAQVLAYQKLKEILEEKLKEYKDYAS